MEFGRVRPSAQSCPPARRMIQRRRSICRNSNLLRHCFRIWRWSSASASAAGRRCTSCAAPRQIRPIFSNTSLCRSRRSRSTPCSTPARRQRTRKRRNTTSRSFPTTRRSWSCWKRSRPAPTLRATAAIRSRRRRTPSATMCICWPKTAKRCRTIWPRRR